MAKTKLKALVFNDDTETLESIGHLLKKQGFEVTSCTTLSEAKKHSGQKFNAVIGDLYLGDTGAGAEYTVVNFLHEIKALHPETHLAILTAGIIFPEARILLKERLKDIKFINIVIHDANEELNEFIKNAKKPAKITETKAVERNEIGIILHPLTPTEKYYLTLNPNATPAEKESILNLVRALYNRDSPQSQRITFKKYLDAYKTKFERQKTVQKRKPAKTNIKRK